MGLGRLGLGLGLDAFYVCDAFYAYAFPELVQGLTLALQPELALAVKAPVLAESVTALPAKELERSVAPVKEVAMAEE